MARRKSNPQDGFDTSPLSGLGSDPLTRNSMPGKNGPPQKPPTGCLVSILFVFFVIIVFCLFMFFSL